MVRNKLAAAIAAIGALQAGVVNALGLGNFEINSALNQPLDAEIRLLNTEDLDQSQLLVSLANPDEFKNAGVSREFFLTNIKFHVEMDGAGNGVIKLSTREPVIEPYLNFLIEARWPTGRLLREYTVLLDLPVFSESEAAPVEQAAAARSMNEPEPVETSAALPAARPAPMSSPATSSAQGRAQGDVSSGEKYRVRSDDTLWQIALKARPANSVSVQQTMVGIQDLNPHAFINGNINRLKAGSVLRLPTERDISVSDRQAVGEVASQNKAWRSGADVTSPSEDVQLDATATTPEQMAETYDEPRLSISSGGESDTAADGSGDGSGSAAIADELAATAETLDKTARENQELQQRLGDMEEKLATLQRLLELKDDQLAALQNEAAAEQGDVISDGEAMAADDTAMGVEETSAVEGMAVEGVAADTGMEPEGTAPAPEPKPAPIRAPAPVPEPSFTDELFSNPLYMGGAGALILAAAALVLMRRRKEEEQVEPLVEEEADELEELAVDDIEPVAAEAELEVDDEPELDSAEQLAAELEEQIAADNAEQTARAAEQELAEAEAAETAEQPAVLSETGDVIAEADIYIAYGRYQQAIDLLRSAVANEPGRSDLYLKLMEVCVETRDKAGFQENYVALKALNDDEAEAAVKEMLSTVDGVSDWLDDLPGGSDIETIDSLDSGLESFDSEFAASNVVEEPVSADEIELNLDDDQADGFDQDLGELDLDLDSSDLVLDDAEPDTTLDELGLELDEVELDEGGADSGIDLSDTVETPVVTDDDLAAAQELEDDLDLSDLDLNAEVDQFDADMELELDAELDLGNEELTASSDMAEVSAEPLPESIEEDQAEETVEQELEALDAGLDSSLDEDLHLDLDADLDLNALDEVDLDGALSAELDAEFGDLDAGEPESGELASGDDSGDLEELASDLGAELEELSEDLSLDSMEEPALDLADDLDLELDSLELDVDDTQAMAALDSEPMESAVSTEPADEGFVSEPDVDADGEEFDFLADTDEVATKLDLARAYIDMGDADGARDILEEVVQEGDEKQQQEANSLLERID